MAPFALPLDAQRMLFADWLGHLAREQGISISPKFSTDGEALLVGLQDEYHILVRPMNKKPGMEAVPSGPDHDDIFKGLVREALRRVADQDFGNGVWYSTAIAEQERNLLRGGFGTGLMQLLSLNKPITGWRRLGRRALLEFREIDDGDDGLTIPGVLGRRAEVDIHVKSPGPCPGHLAMRGAANMIEAAAAVCTFGLGRPMGESMLPPPFQTREERWPGVIERESDASVLNLARDSVPLDIFEYLPSIGGPESVVRVTSALRSFDAALRQERDDVAIILFVVAAEALTVPMTPWRDSRLTKRFIEFFNEMMPDDLDRIVNHDNAKQAFDLKLGSRSVLRLRKDLLQTVYELRSTPLHQGLAAGSRDRFGFTGNSGNGRMRRLLTMDFVEAAILHYLRAPRSSLFGHPELWQTDAKAATQRPRPGLRPRPRRKKRRR